MKHGAVVQIRRKVDSVAFELTGRRSGSAQVKAVELPKGADRFNWARLLRAQTDLRPREKLLGQTIAENISTESGKPYYGLAFASRQTMSAQCGMPLRSVDEALATLKRRGWISARKRFGGTLQIRLATPEGRQFRIRMRDCGNTSNPDNLADVHDTISHTSATSISHTYANNLSNEQGNYLSNRALDKNGDTPLNVDALHLRARELECMCERVNRSLTDFEGLPDHVKLILTSDLEDGSLTYAGLELAFDRHAPPIKLPSLSAVRAALSRSAGGR